MAKVGVVGAGYWGKNLVRCFAELSALTAVCDANAQALKAARHRYPYVACYSSVGEMLRDGKVDSVVVATPAATHFGIARQALEAGCHVFVEKPFTGNLAHAAELVSIAESRGRVLMVGLTFLYNHAVRKVKEFIDAGEIGRVYYALSQRLNLGRVQSDVNAWWNLAPHDVSIILYWFAATPVEVSCWGATYLQPGIEDVALGRLAFADGRAGFVHVSWLDPNKVRRATVVGSAKMVVCDDVLTDRKVEVYNHGIDQLRPGGSLGQFSDYGQFQLIQRLGDIQVPKIDLEEPLLVETRHFLECVDQSVPCCTSGRMALEVLRVLEAGDRSLRNAGRPVRIPEGKLV